MQLHLTAMILWVDGGAKRDAVRGQIKRVAQEMCVKEEVSTYLSPMKYYKCGVTAQIFLSH